MQMLEDDFSLKVIININFFVYFLFRAYLKIINIGYMKLRLNKQKNYNIILHKIF